MKKVLLAIEDYNELLQSETALKKTGFDCISLQNDVAIPERVMAYNPDVVVMTAVGKRINGHKLVPRLRAMKPAPEIVLIVSKKTLNINLNGVAASLDAPVQPLVLLEVLSSLLDLDEETVLHKYESARAGENNAPVVDILENFRRCTRSLETKEKSSARAARYKKIATASELPPFRGFTRQQVQEQIKEFRADEGEETKRIDDERRMFALILAQKFRK